MTEAEKYRNNNISKWHFLTIENSLEFAESYKDHCIASITDEMIEDAIVKNMPIVMKNSKGNLVQPFISYKAYENVVNGCVKAFKKLLNKNS